MKKRRVGKKLWSLALTLAMVLTFTVTALPAYADGGKISVIYAPSVTDNGETLTSTDFHLYKVATFGRYTKADGDEKAGKVKMVLEPAFNDGSVDLNTITPPEDTSDTSKQEYKAWQAAWISAAAQLEHYVNTPAEGQQKPTDLLTDANRTLTVSTDKQSLGSYANGIYLLTGDKEKVGKSYWWPVPVLIMVLNGETTFTLSDVDVKMQSESVVRKHTITKSWVDTEDTKAARPESIDVGIFLGTEQIDTVQIRKKKAEGDPTDYKEYSYTWYTTVEDVKDDAGNTVHRITYTSKDPDPDSDTDSAGKTGVATSELNEGNGFKKVIETSSAVSWDVKELRSTDGQKDNLKYYDDTYTKTQDSTGEFFTVTNEFKTADLTITKVLKNYLSQEGGNAMVVFEIRGYVDGNDEPVYYNTAGMAFTAPGDQTLKIDNIPCHLDRLVVKEVYSTNYKLSEGDAERELTADGNHYSVTYTNEYNDGPPVYSSGVVNLYDDGTYTAYDETNFSSDSPK